MPRVTQEYKPEKPRSSPLNPKIPTKASECPKCKEVFTTPSGFDKHLKRVSWVVDTYKMICQDPESVGMSLNKKGYWGFPLEGDWWGQDE